MKLVELLAKYMKSWPHTKNGTPFLISQSKNGLLLFHRTVGGEAFWIEEEHTLPLLASDYETAQVTKGMWQKAKEERQDDAASLKKLQSLKKRLAKIEGELAALIEKNPHLVEENSRV